MKFIRHFTEETKSDVYGGLRFVERTSAVRDKDGSKLSNYKVVVPDFWDQNSVDILASKYCRKAGVPDTVKYVNESGIPIHLQRQVPESSATFGGEHYAGAVIDRIVGAWAYCGLKNKYFDDDQSAIIFFDELRWLMMRQYFAPASPQWFNAGLWWAYGIEGERSGLFKVDNEGKPYEVNKSYKSPILHACFIQSLKDDLVNAGGIMDLVTREAKVFKFGGGSGSNFSALRGEGEELSGGGKSSGFMSFVKVNDVAAGAIKSGGTTRRAARMVILDCDHPDLEAFIDWKVKEEDKVAALVAGSKVIRSFISKAIEASKDDNSAAHDFGKAVKEAVRLGVPRRIINRVEALIEQGLPVTFEEFNTDFEGEAYKSVSGQNANNSVRVTNEFMMAVDENKEFTLQYRTEKAKRDRKPLTRNAKDLFDKINLAAWSCADPGLQFHTTINEWNPCLNDGEIEASNPCSEYKFLNDTGCNLASMRLTAFMNRDGFSCDAFSYACKLVTTALDITVTLAGYPSPEIAVGSNKYRTLGLGYCDLGALLMRCGVPYDSEQGRTIAGSITALMHFSAVWQSAAMAKDLGTYPRYDANKEQHLKVLQNHLHACVGGEFTDLTIHPQRLGNDVPKLFKSLRLFAATTGLDAVSFAKKHGQRNAQLTLLAPTGTIGILMGCDTTGVEPDFALVKHKKLAGGGYMKIVNQSVEPALVELGYTTLQIQDIKEWVIGKKDRSEFFAAVRRMLPELQNPESLPVDDVFDLSHIPALKDMTDLGYWNDEVLGRGTIEGAPHIQEKDLAVFDCANRCGKYGKRLLSVDGHIYMMAAVQPFLSGAISKTINLDESATVRNFHNAHFLSWRMCLKAVALYRDGSKLNQPLMAVGDDEQTETLNPLNGVEKNAEIIYKTVRKKLGDKRFGYTQKMTLGNHKFYLRTGQYSDGTLGEIFIDSYTEGAFASGILKSFAVAVSIALQYGVPLEEYVDAFAFMNFEPNGILEHHDRLTVGKSIIDVIFRDLAINYLGRDDLAHRPPAEAKEEKKPEPVTFGIMGLDQQLVNHYSELVKKHIDKQVVNGEIPVAVNFDDDQQLATLTAENERFRDTAVVKIQTARLLGYEGTPCNQCKSMTLLRVGKCLMCKTCNNSTGCD